MKYIELFLECMEDINQSFKYSLTPLIYAALLGNDEVVKLLMEKGAAIKSVNHLRMITIAPLEKALKQKLAEDFISSLKNQKDFESAQWVFNASRTNNFNSTLDNINNEINPKKYFRHVFDPEVEYHKIDIKAIFDKYDIKRIGIEKIAIGNNEKDESNLPKITVKKSKKRIFSKIFDKLKFK